MIRVEVDIPPGDFAINRAYRKSKKGMRQSPAYREAKKLLADELREVALGPLGNRLPFARARVEIVAYWPTWGDVDAPVKAILDAVAKSGIVRNDRDVWECHKYKFENDLRPRVIVEVSPL